jgi:UDP-2-acetamido-2,6-beta-L-arabino-hexul-4-ose reductase
MKSILVTGAAGFIGRNLIAQLRLNENIQVIEITRNNTSDELIEAVKTSDFIYHIAGVNRPKNESDFKEGNTNLTELIVSTLKDNGLKTPLLITSSTQAVLDNPYGKSKHDAEEIVFNWHRESDSPVYVYRLPGIFGKWARPNYNSVVATFSYNIANGLPVNVSNPTHVVTLAYIDDVIASFTSLIDTSSTDVDYTAIQSIEQTFEVTLDDLKDRIEAIHNIRTSLVIPNLKDILNKYLYATYISYLAHDNFAYSLQRNSDQRGWLAEFVKSEYAGQIFISKTKPGISRGDHWHHTKIEKFLVVSGTAKITFRDKKDNSTEVISFITEGDEARVLDIPVGYVHAITNVGETDLITIFWANELLDKEHPDTYYEKVSEEDA